LGPVIEKNVLVEPDGPRTWGDWAAFVANDEPPDVTNAQGSVVVQGGGPVHWQGSFSDCSCPYATATIP
jgi:hypothetical protein